MRVSMKLILGPPAQFVEGRHRSEFRGDVFDGVVSAESVTFLGGQNTQPSIGGVLILENPNDDSRYRLRFPPTRLGAGP
jgi:hypothetical protein